MLAPRKQLPPFIYEHHLVRTGCNSALTPARPFHFYAFHLALVFSLTLHFLPYIEVLEGALPFYGQELLSSLVHMVEPHFEILGVSVAAHSHYSHFLLVPMVACFPSRNCGWLEVVSAPSFLDSRVAAGMR